MTKEQKRIVLQVVLFVLTFITTTIAGTEWAYNKSIFSETYTWSDFARGLSFSIPLLLFLTVHEFGHYFTALIHKVRASLPYYIPVPPILLSIGTLGAVIRIRSRVVSNIQHFDIGLAGPLSGFIVALAILFYGFKTLPPPEYIFEIHPEYEQFGLDYADHVYSPAFMKEQLRDLGVSEENMTSVPDVQIGTNLLFMFFERFVADPARVPNPRELMHYPVLFAGFLALLFTSLNLLPIGQLDGGHVIYGLFGYKGHRLIAIIFFVLLLLYSGLGIVDIRVERDELAWIIPVGIFYYYICYSGLRLPMRDTIMYALLTVAFLYAMAWFFPSVKGYSGWLVFGLLVGRLLGVYHPPSEIEVPLDPRRQLLGWICLIVFLLSFSPAPLMITDMDLGK